MKGYGMIMLGFMETEKEFIKNWEKYRGAAGCLRYLAYWFLFGIIVIPLMLTAINPDIWSTVRMDQLAEEAATFFGLGFWLCILPSLLIGLGTWDKKNRKYKYLLRGICGTCLSKKDPGKEEKSGSYMGSGV